MPCLDGKSVPPARLRLVFSSGTGNTFRAARWLAELARSRGVEATLAEAEGISPRDLAPDPGALLGLLHPTHGFTAPWNNLRFALRLPRGRGAPAFVLVTRGGTKAGPVFLPGMEGTAAWIVALVLLLKGYRVRGVTGLDMPSNWISLHPGFSRPAAEAILARARPRAERFLEELLAGKRRYRGFLPLLLGLLLLQVSFMYVVMGRFMLAKLFFADERCTSCGACAERCPNRAIRMWALAGGERRPYWTYLCAGCMRCMGFCPAAAVEAGHSWMFLLVYLVSAPFGVYLLLLLLPGAAGSRWVENEWVSFFLNYPFALAVAAAGYLVFWALVGWRPINRLFAYTTLTRIYRRYHEPGTSLSDLHGGRSGGRSSIIQSAQKPPREFP